HAGAERIDQPVRPGGQALHDLLSLLLLQIDADRSAAPAVHVVPALAHPARRSSHAIDADDVGAHVAEHHAAHGSRPDARQLDDREATQWSHRMSSRGIRRRASSAKRMTESPLADPTGLRRACATGPAPLDESTWRGYPR